MSREKKSEIKLENWFKQHTKVLVALSGGVDSCLVAYLARQFNGKENAVALIGVSPSLKQRDLNLARQFCADHDISVEEIYPNEIEDANYAANPVNRCYFCKSALYDEMLDVQKKKYPSYEILNGNNYDDRGDYRPGMKAATEFSALSPLMDCEITKESIRLLSAKYQLKVWDKPASPCLSSRFPYGESITVEKLQQIEKAEDFIFDSGFSDVRVRYYPGGVKVEVPTDEISRLKNMQEEVASTFKDFGFNSISIDEEGLVSGKLNRGVVK